MPDIRSASDPAIESERLTLAPLTVDRAHGPYLRWMNDPDVTRYLESRFHTYTADDLVAYIAAMNAKADEHLFGIFVRATGAHIGNIKLGPVNAIHGSADIGIIVGDKAEWGKGYATEAIAALAGYAFTTLGLRKLTAGCYASNGGSASAFRKAGFAQEGLRRSQRDLDGAREDEILLGLVAPA